MVEEVHGGPQDEAEESEGVAYRPNRTSPNPLAVVDWQVRYPHAIGVHGRVMVLVKLNPSGRRGKVQSILLRRARSPEFKSLMSARAIHRA